MTSARWFDPSSLRYFRRALNKSLNTMASAVAPGKRRSAREAALAIIMSALIASKPAPGDEELLKMLSELTEDRIERYLFY